ncbi:MAG: type VI secretion system baseplate subunit TssF/IglH [Francisella endosymbiont of Hyalomma asiaticum]
MINDLDKRINDYSNSLLFKYYNSLYYFLPKSCLLKVKDKGHNGYYIYLNEHFLIEDKRTNKVLTYSTKSENIVLPIQEIKTIKQNETSLNLSISFYNHFEYDNLTIWLDPELCIQNPFPATYINQIISNSGTIKIEFSSHIYATKNIEIKPINIQLRPTEMLIFNLHLLSLMYGFNIKIKDLFKYKNDDFKKIDLFIKVMIDNYPKEKVNYLFKANLIPVFNSFNDYSNSTTALIKFSNIKLTHYQKDDAQAIEVLSVYENNKQFAFDIFLFSGLNEYYFNRNTQSLNYNVAFPQLNNKIVETKVHTYAT